MKELFKKLVAFSLFFILFIILIDYSTSSFIAKKAIFKLNSKPKYVLFGHSHPECDYNDSLIMDLKNLSQSGEPYLYTFHKIENILDQNKSVKVIFLEFTNNQIKYKMNNSIWDAVHLSNTYQLYSPFLTLREKGILFKNNTSGFINGFALSLHQRIKRIESSDYNFIPLIGKYLYLERDKTAALIKFNSKSKKIKKSKKWDYSAINIHYLQKIINLCKKREIRLILVRSPLHPNCKDYSNEGRYQSILQNKLGKVEYIDFSKFKLKDTEFGDYRHLNHKGAKLFSSWFSNLLKNELLTKKDISRFVEDEIRIHNKLINQKKSP